MRLTLVAFSLVAGLAFFQIWHFGQQQEWQSCIVARTSSSKKQGVVSKHTKLILLGAHDRFNFGDLLFEKVVTKLLVSRKGYNENDFISTGLVGTNMSMFGGNANIVSMKQAIEMSHNATITGKGGPFNIIYLGGETLGCSLRCGLGMLPDLESRRRGKLEAVGDCAYLFPKELLVPAVTPNGTRMPVAVVNSAGGKLLDSCRNAIQSADFVAFRDLSPNRSDSRSSIAQSRPDSAVMTDILFRHVIAEYGQKQEMRTVREVAAQGYLAVQFKSSGISSQVCTRIARVLDDIYGMTKMATVFFRAGSVPDHDLLGPYMEVASKMNTPTYVFTTEHVWSVVALIRYSSAVISTSLHVRIMAFVHGRPRVTVCPMSGKHASFIQLYDSEEASPCIISFDDRVKSALEESLAHFSNATNKAQDKAIASYLQGFEQWSSMLDDS